MPRPKYDYGRIRLWRPNAELLAQLLQSERDLLAIGRKNRPEGDTTAEYNLRIKQVDQIIAELRRMTEEKGWHEPE